MSVQPPRPNPNVQPLPTDEVPDAPDRDVVPPLESERDHETMPEFPEAPIL